MFKEGVVAVGSIVTVLVVIGAMTFFKGNEHLVAGGLCCVFSVLCGIGLIKEPLRSMLLNEGSSADQTKQLVASMIVSEVMGITGLAAHFTGIGYGVGPPPTSPEFNMSLQAK